MKLRIEPFIWFTEEDCSNSVKYDQVQVLSYSKYSLLFLPEAGIEQSNLQMISFKSTFQQTPYPQHHVSLPDMKHLKKAKGHINQIIVICTTWTLTKRLEKKLDGN